jgi:hypothetical protein
MTKTTEHKRVVATELPTIKVDRPSGREGLHPKRSKVQAKTADKKKKRRKKKRWEREAL